MCARFLDEKDDRSKLVVRIFEAMRKGMTVTPGGISFSSLEPLAYRHILSEYATFNDDVAMEDRYRLSERAMHRALGEEAFSLRRLNDILDDEEKQYLKRPLEKYRILSSWNVPAEFIEKPIELNGARIRFPHAAPSDLQLSDTMNRRIAEMLMGRGIPRNYAPVTVQCTGRTLSAAFESGLTALANLRSLLNLKVNLGVAFSYSFGQRPRMINRIVPGPFTTIHPEAGGLADEAFWYEPDYVGPADIVKDKAPVGDVAFADDVASKIQLRDRRTGLWYLLRRYNYACDLENFDLAIVQLWSVLEELCSRKAKSVEVARRVGFLFRDSDLHTDIVTAIADYRNRHIHEGRSSSSRDSVVHLLRTYVEQALMFQINNFPGGKSIAETADFLALPLDMHELSARIALLERAKQFRSPHE
jgi:hypothetical protein